MERELPPVAVQMPLFRSLPSRLTSLRAALLIAGIAVASPSPAEARPPAGAVSASETAATRSTQSRRTPRRRSRRSRHRHAAAPTPKWTTPRGSDALRGDLHTMLTQRVRRGQWGVMVVSLTKGDTLYSYKPEASLQPASNMKLFTTALALDQFGPNFQFSTDVLRDGTVGADGALHGSLILRGDGDPALSKRFVAGGPGAAMDLLAQMVATSGIKRVDGDLIADASAFDTARVPQGWQHRYLASAYAARVSALSLNENLVWVVVQPGATSHDAPAISLDPATDIRVVSQVRTVAGSRGARVGAHTRSDGAIEVRGWIGTRSGERRYELVVEDPTSFAAGAFRRALSTHGVTVTGPTRFGPRPITAVRVASLPSPPLARMLDVMNGESINHYAELLFRNAGRTVARSQIGSVESANHLLQQFMTEKVGAAPGDVIAADGSGLSTMDRVTPRALVKLLAYANRASWRDSFHASLPVAGESELLRRRMKSTPAQGNLHAKTGTTNTVISLGGYVTAQDGELIAFAFIYNGTDRSNAKSTIDQMGATLASFVRSEQ